MAHVFIVNEKTFDLHLKYQFAGTGSKDKTVEFLSNREINVHPRTEGVLVGMIADISRIRPGDDIIFYLQATSSTEGRFFGSFKASSYAFFDENDDQNYLHAELEKPLTFRIQIVPNVVYAEGITEHEFLDSLDGIDKPSDLVWSLIYRKLGGNRGCTPITDKEFDFLMKKLKKKNNGVALSNKGLFYYDSQNHKIGKYELVSTYDYVGRQDDLSVKNRMLYKMIRGMSLEVHLQAYVLQNFDQEPLKSLLFETNDPIWIGNEVSCGVGEQRIDILTIQKTKSLVRINILELKRGHPYQEIATKQLPWYIQWLLYYIANDYEQAVQIQPIILSKKAEDDDEIVDLDISQFSTNKENLKILPIKYISYSLSENNEDILFEEYTNKNE